MTLDEKIQLIHGDGWGVLIPGRYVAPAHNGGAGFVPGIPRLHIPDLNLADSAVGIRMSARDSRYATLLPSVLCLAATWDSSAGVLYGDVIGRELRNQGYNVSIGGGVNLMREPRNGRSFEYAGEDPLLAGTIVGNLIAGLQSNHIIGDVKHLAFNDQETDRATVDVILDHRIMRETDLLAFEIANRIGHPLAAMCSYNLIDGMHACENSYILNDFLKHDLGFKGFVLSDWEAAQSTEMGALNGLDMEQPGNRFFGSNLKQAVLAGRVPLARLNEMVGRILYAVIASGAFDQPPVHRVVNPFTGLRDSQHVAEEGIVLLQNNGSVLPLSKSQNGLIAVIGSHADVGVLSGGGSAQVDAPGGNVIDPSGTHSGWGDPIYFPSAPMQYIHEKAPRAKLEFDSGDSPNAAAALAARASLAIVFLHQHQTEGTDSATLSLPDNQDALVAAVAAANPTTVVIVENGGPVSMPWATQVSAVLESWYPGIGGGQAIANILFGDVNPSGKLPATFARQDADLPYPVVPGLLELAKTKPVAVGNRARKTTPDIIKVDYNLQGLEVGYKWFQIEHKRPLFAFGHGLSYTTFAYSSLTLNKETGTVNFNVKNTGGRSGDEIAQVYATLPAAAGEPFRRLVGWKRITVNPGETATVSLTPDATLLSVFDLTTNSWERPAGNYTFEVGAASDDLRLKAELQYP